MDERIKEDIKALVELAIEFKKIYGKDVLISTQPGLACGYNVPEIENWVSIRIDEK